MPIIPIDSPQVNQRFYQNELQHCFPLLHPGIIVGLFSVFTGFLVILGAYLIYQSNSQLFIEIPVQINSNQLQTNTIDLTNLDPTKEVCVYYKLPKFYQNVRSYVQGMDYVELASDSINLSTDCTDSANALKIPCNIVFSTTPDVQLNIQQQGQPVNLVTTNITWSSDRSQDTMFGKGIKSLSDWERYAVWMRQSPYEDAVKLLGRVNLTNGSAEVAISQFQVKIAPQQSTNASIILAQMKVVGGQKENFAMGLVCVVVGSAMGLVAIILGIIWAIKGPMDKRYFEQ